MVTSCNYHFTQIQEQSQENGKESEGDTHLVNVTVFLSLSQKAQCESINARYTKF